LRKDIPSTSWRWKCRSVGFYRDMEATAASICGDGSILAVTYEQVCFILLLLLRRGQGRGMGQEEERLRGEEGKESE